MTSEPLLPTLLDDRTDELTDWCRRQLDEAETPFEAAQRLVTRLGAHSNGGVTEFGFWLPESDDKQEVAVWLELLRPADPIDFSLDRQNVRFHRVRLPLTRCGDFLWAAVADAQLGRRDAIGDFYWTRRQLESADEREEPAIVRDLLADSLPFGAFAPAELYDIEGMLATRGDAGHFQALSTAPDPDGTQRVTPPVNVLQIHPGTASPEGTLAGLRRIYGEISAKISENEPLSTAEQHFVGYDGIQLTPIEPGIEHEGGPGFWQIVEDHPDSDMVTFNLQRPDMTNWGYDAILMGASAINPVLLESKRPDELLDLIVTLHNFAGGPIHVTLDLALGHLDNQALLLLDPRCFAGASRYGQSLNVGEPFVRALLTEIVRRKLRYGADGIRIDEAQEIQLRGPDGADGSVDRDLLARLNQVEQRVAGIRYRPWMVFEDGRPWPVDDEPLASSYRSHGPVDATVWQLGPLSLAGEVPYRQTYWLDRWWRVEEIANGGSQWVTGSANQDTLRRASQLEPAFAINHRLGASLPEIFHNGFDNPAISLLTYAMLPGIPLDFLPASLHAPWSFVRNTDDQYSVKIVADEAHFLDWAVSEAEFAREDSLRRLKALGFYSLDGLKRFMGVLNHVVQATDDDLGSIVAMLNAVEPPLSGLSITEASLKMLARAWMDDLAEYCNVWRFTDELDRPRSDFNHAVRVFRRQRPWLMENFGLDDQLAHHAPSQGTVLVYGVRHAPGRDEQVLLVANLEGLARTVTPTELPLADLPGDGWQTVLTTPGLVVNAASEPVELANGAGALFVRSE